MSLNTNRTKGTLTAHAKGSPTNFEARHCMANMSNQTHLERERKLARELFEAYLQSPHFEKDVYQLESTLMIRIDRRVETSINHPRPQNNVTIIRSNYD